MSENFHKKATVLEKAIWRMRENILRRGKTKSETAARVTGAVALDFAHFMTWTARNVFVDNAVLRAGERSLSKINVGKNKNGQPKKFQSFVKRNPNLSIHVVYYAVLAATWFGMKHSYDAQDKEGVATELVSGVNQEYDMEKPVRADTYAGYLSRIRPITPLLIANVLTYEGVVVDENGMHVPYDDATGAPLKPGDVAKGTPTICIGSTKDIYGRKVTSYTKPIAPQNAYVLTQSHIEDKETYFLMYCYEMAGIKPANTNQALALASIIYNSGTNLFEKTPVAEERFRNLRNLWKQNGEQLSDAMIRKEFKQLPIDEMQQFGAAFRDGDINRAANLLGLYTCGRVNGKLQEMRGLWVRRFVESGILLGKINPTDLMNAPVKSLSEFLELMGGKKSAFFTGSGDNIKINRATLTKFNKWLKNPVNRKGEPIKDLPTINSVLAKEVTDFCNDGKCVVGGQYTLDIKTDLTEHLRRYKYAKALFDAGRYQSAAKEFNNILATDNTNALIYNDLSATYNRMGEYDKAISSASKVIRTVPGVSPYEKGAAYFNAGFAAEKLGQKKRALENYKLSVKYGNNVVSKHVARLEKQLNLTSGSKKVKNVARSKNMRIRPMAKSRKSAR